MVITSIRWGRLGEASPPTKPGFHFRLPVGTAQVRLRPPYDAARRCARHHTPNAITTAPARPNQVMAYCM